MRTSSLGCHHWPGKKRNWNFLININLNNLAFQWNVLLGFSYLLRSGRSTRKTARLFYKEQVTKASSKTGKTK